MGTNSHLLPEASRQIDPACAPTSTASFPPLSAGSQSSSRRNARPFRFRVSEFRVWGHICCSFFSPRPRGIPCPTSTRCPLTNHPPYVHIYYLAGNHLDSISPRQETICPISAKSYALIEHRRQLLTYRLPLPLTPCPMSFSHN